MFQLYGIFHTGSVFVVALASYSSLSNKNSQFTKTTWHKHTIKSREDKIQIMISKYVIGTKSSES